MKLYGDLSSFNKPKTGFGHAVFIGSLPDYLDCCKCKGGKRGYSLKHKETCKPEDRCGTVGCKCNGCGCTIWVHSDCGKPSFSFARECQVCQKLYMPTDYPDYDWLCLDCFPRPK